ncbi:hypothetical protein ACFFRR_007220 [Megaselia abdita]
MKSTSRLIPSILDQSTKSIKFRDLISKFERNPDINPNFAISAHKSFDELQIMNTILKDKIIKLKAKFEGNLEKHSVNSLYELTNTNLKRVESLQRDLQDAKIIFIKRM